MVSANYFAGEPMEPLHAATADLISAAQFALGFTKRGVNHGKLPIKSCVTRICPSQSGPLPMPMVGTEIFCGNFLRHRRRHQLQHDGKRARVRQSLGVFQQTPMFRVLFAFDVIAAFFQNVLRQHAQMTAKRNARRDDGSDLRQNFPAAFRLHKFRAGGEKFFRHWPPRRQLSRNF